MALDSFSDKELKDELERRERTKPTAPPVLDNPNWKPLLDVCHDYLHELEVMGWADDDYKHYIYEAALDAIYGKDVWNFINGR